MRLFFIFLFFLSCSDTKKKNFVSVKKNGVIIEGNIINDTTYIDTINYYDLNRNLFRKEFFKDGKQNGNSIEYYANGNPMIITSYSNGLKNGYNSYYDTLGKCYYKDFYYYNLIVGPVIFFDRNEEPKRYFFANLQNETLVDIDYLNWHGIKEIYSNCINFTSNVQRRDSTREISVLLYLIAPPKFRFNYSICKKKMIESEDKFKPIISVTSDLPFINAILPQLKNDEHYAVGLTIYDSLIQKKTIIYKDI